MASCIFKARAFCIDQWACFSDKSLVVHCSFPPPLPPPLSRYLNLQLSSSLSLSQLSLLLGFKWNLLPTFSVSSPAITLVPTPGFSPTFGSFLAPSLAVRGLFSSPSLSYAASDTMITIASNTAQILNISGPFAPLPTYPSVLATNATLTTQQDGSLAGALTASLYGLATASGTMVLTNTTVSMNLTSADSASGALVRAAAGQLASIYGARFSSTLASDFIATSASAALDTVTGVRYLGLNFTGSYPLLDFCNGLGLQWWFGASDFQALNPAVFFAAVSGFSLPNGTPLSPSYSLSLTLSSPILSITRLPASITVTAYDSLTLSIPSSFSPLTQYPSWVVSQAVFRTIGASGLTGTAQSVISGQLRASGTVNVSVGGVVTLNVTSVDPQGMFFVRLAAPQILSLYGVTIPPTNSNVVDPPTSSAAAVFSSSQGAMFISISFSNAMPIATLTNTLGLTWSLNAYQFQIQNVSLQFVPTGGSFLPSGSTLVPTFSAAFTMSVPLLNINKVPARMDVSSPTSFSFTVTGQFVRSPSIPT